MPRDRPTVRLADSLGVRGEALVAHRVPVLAIWHDDVPIRDLPGRGQKREAQAAGRLSHPSIVSVFDVGEDYFVMEYLEGSTLQVILRDRGQIPADEAVRILTPLADALDYAHRSGIVHRDIKPGNVFVLADGRPKLMDFGVAHLESSSMTAQGHFFGSPSYMAPEQVSGGQVAAAADLFSLGVWPTR